MISTMWRHCPEPPRRRRKTRPRMKRIPANPWRAMLRQRQILRRNRGVNFPYTNLPRSLPLILLSGLPAAGYPDGSPPSCVPLSGHIPPLFHPFPSVPWCLRESLPYFSQKKTAPPVFVLPAVLGCPRHDHKILQILTQRRWDAEEAEGGGNNLPANESSPREKNR